MSTGCSRGATTFTAKTTRGAALSGWPRRVQTWVDDPQVEGREPRLGEPACSRIRLSSATPKCFQGIIAE